MQMKPKKSTQSAQVRPAESMTEYSRTSAIHGENNYRVQVTVPIPIGERGRWDAWTISFEMFLKKKKNLHTDMLATKRPMKVFCEPVWRCQKPVWQKAQLTWQRWIKYNCAEKRWQVSWCFEPSFSLQQLCSSNWYASLANEVVNGWLLWNFCFQRILSVGLLL